jgi:hypothetical protein
MNSLHAIRCWIRMILISVLMNCVLIAVQVFLLRSTSWILQLHTHVLCILHWNLFHYSKCNCLQMFGK